MIKLSSTSALVLLWAGEECYTSKVAKDYLNTLDLEEGKPLYEQCQEICFYYDEVIKNRKFSVFNLIEKSIPNKDESFQLIIAGAGLDALGIEVTEHYPYAKVFELDSENMGLKSSLYKSLTDKTESSITFIETNLLDTIAVYRSLLVNGWNRRKPTLLIFEGISYYLPMESIQELVNAIEPSWTIFEFLKQDGEIAKDKVHIAKEVFTLISDQCELPYIRRYNYSDVEECFSEMLISDKHSMSYLEKLRTGTNNFFLEDDSGWIDVCLLQKF